MNIKKKNFIFCLIGMLIFSCLLSCGIYALADSVKFKLGITLKPSIFFALSLNINNSGEQWIFDNRPTNAHVVEDWATVKNLTITLDNELISTANNLELKVYNYNPNSYMNFEIYDTNDKVLSINTTSLKNIEYNNFDTLILKNSAVVENKYIFKILIDLSDQAITQHNVYINNNKVGVAYEGENYAQKLEIYSSKHDINEYDIYIQEILINGVDFHDYSYTEETQILEIPSANIIGDIEIITKFVSKFWDGSIATNFTSGNGTVALPFEIRTGQEFALMAHLINNANSARSYSGNATLNNITTTINQTCDTSITFGNANYKICQNLYLNKNYEEFNSWGSTPPANAWTKATNFSGVLDGGFYAINGFYGNFGIFDVITGTVKNIRLINGYISGGYYHIGAIVGTSNNGYIQNCLNSCTVATTYISAGICGWNYGIIQECCNYGTMRGNSSLIYGAGIVGHNGNANPVTKGIVENCYNMGELIGSSACLGGIASANGNRSNSNLSSPINCCYNAGQLSDTTNDAGGFLGYAHTYGTISDCYYLNTTYNVAVGYNGGSFNVPAYTTEQFANQENFPNWDFEKIWTIKNGFPVLQCFEPYL